MGYEATVVADSVSPAGDRLTTIQVTYPHAIHKDVMTHRKFSRNFQSFRAYPPKKVIEQILAEPFVPESFDHYVPGMGQGEAIQDQNAALGIWTKHIAQSVGIANEMLELDLAKAQVNFVLQDLTWITGLISAIEWDNFFALRLAINPKTGKPLARPEVYKIARLMLEAYDASTPRELNYDEWHLPYVESGEFPSTHDAKEISTGRCARISYLTHLGIRDPSADMGLHDNLKDDGHMSPFEHVARPMTPLDSCYQWHGEPDGHSIGNYCGNFKGWHQYRKDIPCEADFSHIYDYRQEHERVAV